MEENCDPGLIVHHFAKAPRLKPVEMAGVILRYPGTYYLHPTMDYIDIVYWQNGSVWSWAKQKMRHHAAGVTDRPRVLVSKDGRERL